MIENNNPEINVDELMEKIRDEVARRRSGITAPQPNSPTLAKTGYAFNWTQIRRILTEAEQNAGVGISILSMRRFNWAIRWLAKLTGRIVIYLTEVITFPQRRFNQSIVQALHIAVEGLAERDTRIVGLEESMNQALAERDNRIAGLEESMNQSLAERDSRIARLEESLDQGLAERDNRIAVSEKTISHVKTSLVLQERRLSMLLEEARKRLPEPFDQEQLKAFVNEELHLLDPLYVSLEDQFRGTRGDIKERQEVYLSYVKKAGAGTEEYPVLDIGCGRGEWLELLQENGFVAKGVDLNRLIVQQCQDLGLNVVEDEAVEYLRGQKSNSLGLIGGFHIVEHLPTKHMISLFDEALRVLKRGGMVIFETPNPENVLVGSCSFYADPSHKNPIPPDTLAFLLEHRGFIAPEIIRLSPLNYVQYEKDDALKHIVYRFNMEQDYAAIGRKA